MRLTGAIQKQSNSTVQIRPPPWLNLRRKPELVLLPLELDFLYGQSPFSFLLVRQIDSERIAVSPVHELNFHRAYHHPAGLLTSKYCRVNVVAVQCNCEFNVMVVVAIVVVNADHLGHR